jgi:hypothetical protein
MKRRRVEKLADNFLNGSTLAITSARPTYGYVPGPEISNEGSVWEDVLSAREIMELHARERELIDHEMVQGGIVGDTESRVIAEVKASCRPRTTPIRNRLLAQPSEEALRLAAELWERGREKNVVCETQALQQSVSIDDSFNDQSISYASEQESQRLHPTAVWTSGKWLKTGAFMPRRKAVDEDCSRDELGVSSFALPSSRVRPQMPTESIQMDRSRSDGSAATGSSYYTPEDSSNVCGTVAVQSSDLPVQGDKEPGHLPERVRGHNLRHSIADQTSNEANESQPSKRRSLRTAQCRSVEARIEPTAQLSDQQDALSKSTSAQSLPTATENGTSKTLMHRKSESLASELVAIQQPREKPHVQYQNLVGSDVSPFAFRKRFSRAGQEHGKVGDKARVITTPLRTESISTASSLREIDPATSGPSDIPLTPGDTSQVQSATPLTDQQMNRVLRTDTSVRSVKELLRDEMELAGAIFTSLEENEVSTALLPAKGDLGCDRSIHEELADVLLKSIRKETQDTQCWAGTQVLLARAQQDLFTSPDKADPESQLDTATPTSRPRTSSGTRTKKSARNSLLPLSQGRVPSTQALLDTWQGWSTVKKPRTSFTSKRNSLLPQTPSLGKLSTPSAAFDKGKVSTRRRSGLHVSTVVQASCYDFPTNSIDAAAPDVQASAVPAAPESGVIMSTVSFVPTSFLAEAARPKSPPFYPTNDSPGADLSLPSGGEAQDPSFNQSDLDFTITQLAEEVLGTAGSMSF